MGIDATFCTKAFYTLESLKLVVDTKKNFASKAQDRLLEDIMEYRAKYINGLKRALYDYTALVVFGEMRHGIERSTYYNPVVPEGGGRKSSYETARQYNPTSILMAGEKLFAKQWSSSFGGEKWRNICNRVLLNGKIDDAVYVDMCFSLTHNSSPYLDKYHSDIFKIDRSMDYKEVLDFKFEAKSPIDVIDEYVKYVGKGLKKLVTRAIILGLIPERVQQNTNSFWNKRQWEAEPFILEYKGIEWDGIWLSSEVVKHRHHIDDRPCSLLPSFVDPHDIMVGDVLEVKFDELEGYNKIKKGMLVKVVGKRYSGETLEVVFEENVGGHNLDGKCDRGYGLYLDVDYFKKHVVA